MDPTIQKYRALLEVVDQGSFSRAAEVCQYSQSGISRMIADLEQGWGVRLVERSRRGVKLTAEGERIVPLVRDVVEKDRTLQAKVHEICGLRVGTIRIGCFSSVATHWMPRIIAQFRAHYPSVDYELMMGDFEEIERWTREGRVDLGLIADKPKHPVRSRRLASDEMLAVVPQNHPLAQVDRVSLKDLCQDPFMLLQQSGDSEVSGIFAAAGLKPNVKFVTWDDYAIMAMVETGLGVSLLPSLILQRNPYHLIAKHLVKPQYREIYLLVRPHLSRMAEVFTTFLEEQLTSLHR